MSDKIILDLCGGTGAWSRPYAEAGYDVRVITLPQIDVIRLANVIDGILVPAHGILFAPPCTVWANSGVRWWNGRTPDEIFEAARVLIAGLRIINRIQPKWWVIENPVGKMRLLLGEPKLIFDPCDYGNPYTKKTLLWGRFNPPPMRKVKPTEGSKIHKYPPSKDRQMLRSITPSGFAQAFYEANP